MSIGIILLKEEKFLQSSIQDCFGELNLDKTTDTFASSNLLIALKTITDLPERHLANNKKSRELFQTFHELRILSTNSD